MYELRNPFIERTVMGLICDINYDPEINDLIGSLKEPGTNFSTDFIYDKKNGWFNRYID